MKTAYLQGSVLIGAAYTVIGDSLMTARRGWPEGSVGPAGPGSLGTGQACGQLNQQKFPNLGMQENKIFEILSEGMCKPHYGNEASAMFTF